jgi:uncharacterized membrane protein
MKDNSLNNLRSCFPLLFKLMFMNLKIKLLIPIIIFGLISILPFYISCTHDPVVDVAMLDTVCFEGKILPLLQSSCGMTGCHSSGSEARGFNVTDYASVMKSVKAGDPRHSQLYKIITEVNSDNMMPPSRPLTKDQRSLIEVWIAQGAENTKCNPAVVLDTTHKFTDTTIAILDTICFNTQVLPILHKSCNMNGCHSATTSAGNFTATNYETVISAIIPGSPLDSKLYQVISTVNGIIKMPPGNPLTIQERSIIKAWIDQGGINKICADTSTHNPDTIIIPPIDYGDSVCFKQSILPIFVSSCASATGCHNATSHAEGYILTDYASITSISGSIVPGNPNASKLYNVITKTGEDDGMPPSGPLTTSQIDLIRQWITEGALNSDCPNGACDTSSTILFAKQVMPVFVNNCQSCHNTNYSNKGIMLDNWSHAKAAAETIRNNTSVLLGSIHRTSGFSAMPQTYSLDKCSIRIIDLWVEQGKLNN